MGGYWDVRFTSNTEHKDGIVRAVLQRLESKLEIIALVRKIQCHHVFCASHICRRYGKLLNLPFSFIKLALRVSCDVSH
jgi:hypothetical protein